MKKLLLVLTLCIASTSILLANCPLKYGIIGGVNINKENRTGFSATDGLLGYHFGVQAEYFLKNNIYFSSSLLFIQKGSKIDTTMPEDNTPLTIKKRNHYLEIPIHVGYKWNMSQNFALLGSVGPYIGVGLFGKQKGSQGTTVNLYKHEGDKRFEMGFSSNINIQIYEHYRFGVGYHHAFTNAQKWTGDENRNITFSLSYIF